LHYFAGARLQALIATLELKDLASSKGYIALYNCLVLGLTKYKEVQSATPSPSR
jgi:hypothetical protein